MISVSEALDRLFALVTPLPIETVDLRSARGRALAQDAVAGRDQPPFAASAMDGYAVRDEDVNSGATLTVIGEAPAGRAFRRHVGPGQAVRIFTGAPIPDGATRVIIQEDTTRNGNQVTLGDTLDAGPYIRPAGGDFSDGQTVLTAQTVLGPAEIALLASMNLPQVDVCRRPTVAVICTGDELVMPGGSPGPDQIIASNGLGLAAMLEQAGATCQLLPIARDNVPALVQAFDLAKDADLIVTCGGASVGDHDLVASTAIAQGAALDFHKVAVRPGKPLMAGRIGDTPMLGLPGNPVSSMVCASIFMLPMVRVMIGLPAKPAPRRQARLSTPLGKNGPREHYMRAIVTADGISALPRQDSSLLSVLARANALMVRPVRDPNRDIGETVDYIPL